MKLIIDLDESVGISFSLSKEAWKDLVTLGVKTTTISTHPARLKEVKSYGIEVDNTHMVIAELSWSEYGVSIIGTGANTNEALANAVSRFHDNKANLPRRIRL